MNTVSAIFRGLVLLVLIVLATACSNEPASPVDGDRDIIETTEEHDADTTSEDGDQWEEEQWDSDLPGDSETETAKENEEAETHEQSIETIASHGWNFTGPYLVNDSHGTHAFSPYRLATENLGDTQIILWTDYGGRNVICSQKSHANAPWRHYPLQFRAMYPPDTSTPSIQYGLSFFPLSQTRLLLISNHEHMAQFELIDDIFMPVEGSFHTFEDHPLVSGDSLLQLAEETLVYVSTQGDRIQTYAIHTETHEVEGPHTIPIVAVQPSNPVCSSYGSDAYPAANHAVTRLPDGTLVIGTLLSYACLQPSSTCQRYATILGDDWNQWRMGPVLNELCVSEPYASTINLASSHTGVGLTVQDGRLMASLARSTTIPTETGPTQCFGDCSQGLYFGGIQLSDQTAVTPSYNDGAGCLSMVDDSVPAGYADLDCPDETLCSIISYTHTPASEDNGYITTYDLRRLMLSEKNVIATEALSTIRMNHHREYPLDLLRDRIHTTDTQDARHIWTAFQPDIFIPQSITKHFQCSADGSIACMELPEDEDLDLRQQPVGRKQVKIAGFHPQSSRPLISWTDHTPGKALWFDADDENNEQPLWSCLDPDMPYMNSSIQTVVAPDGNAAFVLSLEYLTDPDDFLSRVRGLFTAAITTENLFSTSIPNWQLMYETSLENPADPMHLIPLEDGRFMIWWLDYTDHKYRHLFSVIAPDGTPATPRPLVLPIFAADSVRSLSINSHEGKLYVLQSGIPKGATSTARDLYLGVFDSLAMQWNSPSRFVHGCNGYAMVLDSLKSDQDITALIRCSVDMHILRLSPHSDEPVRVERTWSDYFHGYSDFGYQAKISRYRLISGNGPGKFILVFNLNAIASSGPSHKSGLAMSFIDLNKPQNSKQGWPDSDWLYMDIQQWDRYDEPVDRSNYLEIPEYYNSDFTLMDARQAPDGAVYITYVKHPHLEIPYSWMSNNYIYLWKGQPMEQ